MNILAQNQLLTMSSEEISELLNLRHDNVRQAAKNLQSHGVISFTEISVKGLGRPKRVMQFDKRNSMVIAAKLNDKLMANVIDRWLELESQELQAIPNFTDPAQAARAWAEQYEANAAKQKQLELAAPKVEFHDKIVNDENTFSFRDAAKKIQQRPNKFTAWLRDNNYTCLNNLAKQQYITQGLFVTHSGVSDSEHHFTQCRVTSKGLSYFTSKLEDKKL